MPYAVPGVIPHLISFGENKGTLLFQVPATSPATAQDVAGIHLSMQGDQPGDAAAQAGREAPARLKLGRRRLPPSGATPRRVVAAGIKASSLSPIAQRTRLPA